VTSPGQTEISAVAPTHDQAAEADAARWARLAARIEKLNGSDPNQALAEVDAWIQDEAARKSEEGLVRARRQHATVLRYLGRYQEAIEEFNECKAAFSALGLVDDVYRANAGLVLVLRYTGDYELAIELCQESIAYFDARSDSGESAKHSLNLGLLYRRTGDLNGAQHAYQSALEQFQEIGDRSREAGSSMNLGNLFSDTGNFERALQAIQHAVAIYRELGLESNIAMALSNLGRLHAARGEHGESIAVLTESRRTYSKLHLSRDRAFADLYLLRSYLALNLRREAQRACRSAVSTFDRLDMPYELGQALLIASTIAENSGKVALACRDARRAHEVFSRAGNRVWTHVSAATCAVLGSRARRGIAIPQALDQLAEARQGLEEAGAREWVGQIHLWEGFLQQRLGNRDAARASVRNARGIGEAIRSEDLIYRSHWAEARLEDTAPGDAVVHYRQAAESVERLRLSARASELKASFLGDKTPLYESALAVLMDHFDSDLDQVFEFAERSRSRSLADAMSDGRAAPRGKLDRESMLEARIRELRGKVNGLYEQAYGLSSDTSQAGQARVRGDIEQLERAIESARRELFLIRPSVANSPLANLGAFQESLPEGGVAAIYFETRGYVHALVVTRAEASLHRNLAPLSVVRRHARWLQFHVGKAAYGSEYLRTNLANLRESFNEPLRSLGHWLVLPLLPRFEGAESLLVLPGAVTYGLPFHALMPDERTYLADLLSVHYAPSGTLRVVNRMRPDTPAGRPVLLAISDESLPGVKREVERLGSILPDAVVLTDDEATIERFSEHAPGASAVHLATHGVFREDNPAFSGIKFADGWMTAADLAEICRDASLITLSACETGMGTDRGGGEIMGISQAILGAGCRSLVSSLWTADDAGTVALMTDFYSALKRGVTAPNAMRSAMLSARERDDHPYFWAPFAVFGEGKLPTCR
jgi:tetratricopeptide (TPR) repeat protein